MPKYNTPENGTEVKLFAYVPIRCLYEGIRPGGWIKEAPVIAAFDPQLKDPVKMKEAFGWKDRQLIEIIDEKIKEHFMPRPTGPDHDYHGILACADLSLIPPSSFKKV